MNRIILTIAFLFITSAQVCPQWFWQNPLPQGNHISDIQTINSLEGFACGNNGTLLKTINGSDSWEIVNFSYSVDLLKVQFINSSVGWISGKKDNIVYLYKSTDSGNSWIEQFSFGAQAVSFFFVNENSGWVSADDILFYSSNGGDVWNQLNIFEPINHIYFYDQFNGWLATNNYKIYYTTDGGTNWQYSEIDYSQITKIKFMSNTVGWLIANGEIQNEPSTSIWKTTNGGETWLLQFEDGGWSYSFPRDLTDLDFIDESTGWAVNRLGSVFKTSNGGLNWVQVSSVNSIRLTSINHSILWSAGLFGVFYKSEDGGLTWQKKYIGEFLSDVEELFVLNENIVFAGGDSGLLKTQSGGANWEKIDLNIPGKSDLKVRAIWFKDQADGWIGMEYLSGAGALLKTTDGGYTWFTQIDSIRRVLDIHFINDSLGWFITENKIFKTTDGGIVWSAQSELLEISELMCLQFTSLSYGWVGGYIGLYKTEDGGNSWDEVFPLGIDINAIRIQFLNDLEGWILHNGGVFGPSIFKTIDGGITWLDQSSQIPVNTNISDIFFNSSNNGWIVGHDESFKSIVLHTSDGGDNWNMNEFPSSHRLIRISFIDNDIGWILGSWGTILKTTNGGVTFIEDENNFTQPSEFLLHQNYPNPFNPGTKISWQSPVGSYHTLKVYDILGNEVATLVNEYKEAGYHEIEFNAAGLSSGVYFYRIQVGDFIETKKMVLIR